MARLTPPERAALGWVIVAAVLGGLVGAFLVGVITGVVAF